MGTCAPLLSVWCMGVQEDPAKALSDAERLKRQRMEEEESERSQRLLMEQVSEADTQLTVAHSMCSMARTTQVRLTTSSAYSKCRTTCAQWILCY